MRQNFHEKNIQLKQDVNPDMPGVFVDSDQMQQVFINLILNSIESIKSDGEIKISVGTVNEDAARYSRKPFYSTIVNQPHVEVCIIDNGCGISTNDLENIFNPFFTTKTLGTGLGLSIVYQLVRENNGIIFFESEVDKGTECHLFLPAFDQQQNKEESGRNK
ncbi:MAG: ATP-binding protein [Calditrichia bacterium]